METGYLLDPQGTGPGELVKVENVVLTAVTFEDALKIGRFAKLDTGSLDNMDGSATPVIAGVVLRNIAGELEGAATIDADLYAQAYYLRSGVCTVQVKSGETPTQGGRVYVSNAGNANDGMATATATDVAVNAEFICAESTGCWRILLTTPPGDIADHIGDAVGAHAATAISFAPTGTIAATTVQAAVAEVSGDVTVLSPFVPAAAVIADPGDAGAIAVARSGNCAITTTIIGGETRTVAAPAAGGLILGLDLSVDGGNVAITVASAINQAGNTIITMGDVGDVCVLYSVKIGAAYAWRVLVNDGCALS